MLELNNKSFSQTVESDQLTVVDFWAGWCMPCKIFEPVLHELADELDGQAQFCKVNVDEENDLALEYQVATIPTVILFKNGIPVERFSGVRGREEVLETIKSHL